MEEEEVVRRRKPAGAAGGKKAEGRFRTWREKRREEVERRLGGG